MKSTMAVIILLMSITTFGAEKAAKELYAERMAVSDLENKTGMKNVSIGHKDMGQNVRCFYTQMKDGRETASLEPNVGISCVRMD